jgi:hypothetical protein
MRLKYKTADIKPNHIENKFFPPVPKSRNRTGLICVKILISHISCLGPFK